MGVFFKNMLFVRPKVSSILLITLKSLKNRATGNRVLEKRREHFKELKNFFIVVRQHYSSILCFNIDIANVVPTFLGVFFIANVILSLLLIRNQYVCSLVKYSNAFRSKPNNLPHCILAPFYKVHRMTLLL